MRDQCSRKKTRSIEPRLFTRSIATSIFNSTKPSILFESEDYRTQDLPLKFSPMALC